MTTKTVAAPAMPAELHAAFTALGWRGDELGGEEEAQLRDQGYLVLRDAIPADALAAMRAAFDRIAKLDNRNDEFLGGLLGRDPVFDRCLRHPRVLHAAGSVLGWDLKLHSVHGRNPGAGVAAQALHQDWPVGHPHQAVVPPHYLLCNSAWLLDDMRLDNGPTRLVPGTHAVGREPASEMTDLAAAHPRELRVVAPAGSILIFNGHLWHSGTANATGAARRVVHVCFERRGLPQPEGEVQREVMGLGTYARLGPAERHIAQV